MLCLCDELFPKIRSEPVATKNDTWTELWSQVSRVPACASESVVCQLVIDCGNPGEPQPIAGNHIVSHSADTSSCRPSSLFRKTSPPANADNENLSSQRHFPRLTSFTVIPPVILTMLTLQFRLWEAMVFIFNNDSLQPNLTFHIFSNAYNATVMLLNSFAVDTSLILLKIEPWQFQCESFWRYSGMSYLPVDYFMTGMLCLCSMSQPPA
jgi:hypothetical protein